jgi:hypothetical protein
VRLDLLLEREPFVENFQATLEEYLSSVHGWDGVVRWVTGAGGSGQRLLVNKKLNVIYPAGLDRRWVRLMTAEFAYHPRLLRRMLQTVYTRWAVSPPFDRLISDAHVNICPRTEVLDNCCIIPGNHSLRLVDFASDSCVVIRKQGFSSAFMEAEIALRRSPGSLPVPQLLAADPQAGWYEEERVTGLPWNRLADPVLKERAFALAHAALDQHHNESAEESSYEAWLARKSAALADAMAALPGVYGEAQKGTIQELIDQLMGQAARGSGNGVTTCMSHGDFQPANILVKAGDGPTIYLIDWEYADRRICYYDALVFALEARFPGGLGARVEALLNYGRGRRLLAGWSLFGEDFDRRQIALFLLEDLLLKLEELAIPGLKRQSASLDKFLQEVRGIDWSI